MIDDPFLPAPLSRGDRLLNWWLTTCIAGMLVLSVVGAALMLFLPECTP